MKYNSQRQKLPLTEYGRYVFQMIEYAKTITDKEQRNIAAQIIIRQMANIQYGVNTRLTPEMEQKLWDHLHMLANYELDVDSPYPPPPLPSNNLEFHKPRYNNLKKDIVFRYYGTLLPSMIEKVTSMNDEEEKQALIADIANNMKKLHIIWNKANVQDNVIREHLYVLSNGQITLPDDFEFSKKIETISNNKNGFQKKNKTKNRKW